MYFAPDPENQAMEKARERGGTRLVARAGPVEAARTCCRKASSERGSSDTVSFSAWGSPPADEDRTAARRVSGIHSTTA